MANETMDLQQLASYLRRDVREISKLASRGHLPGQKIGGEWRFALAEIHHWLEQQLGAYTEEQLVSLELGHQQGPDHQPIIRELLSQATMAVPLTATTKSSVLRELVTLAEQSWQVFDPDAVLQAVRQREEMASTALGSGVALPHPHRPLATSLGESVIAFARITSAIPFGESRGGLTDLFFLVLCRDYQTHLRVLTRLSRMLLRPGFTDSLREAESVAEAWQLIDDAERDLLDTVE